MKRTSRQRLPEPIEVPLPVPAALIGLEPNARRYQVGGCTVLVGSTEATGYHLSISHPSRYPTWDEIAHARYKLVPNVTMALLLPPGSKYINIHPNCFHLWQVPDWLIDGSKSIHLSSQPYS
jgi:hypothetical protein